MKVVVGVDSQSVEKRVLEFIDQLAMALKEDFKPNQVFNKISSPTQNFRKISYFTFLFVTILNVNI